MQAHLIFACVKKNSVALLEGHIARSQMGDAKSALARFQSEIRKRERRKERGNQGRKEGRPQRTKQLSIGLMCTAWWWWWAASFCCGGVGGGGVEETHFILIRRHCCRK